MFAAISKMTNAIASVMDGRLYGAWLYGSVVLDDFRQGWSDIDFIALTDGPISAVQAEKLVTLRQDMLRQEPGNPYYRSFEGVIAGADEYRSRSFSRLVYWGTGGQRVTDRQARDVFAEYELARYGKAVWGDAPWILPAPDNQALNEAVRAHYEAIRKYAVQTDGSLYACGWLLDIARCIHTLRHHDVIAKTQAGFWALKEHIFPEEEPLQRALAIRQNPLRCRDDSQTILWLKTLGPAVQRYADVLERELKHA